VNWSAVPGATKYQIYYRQVGAGAWIKKTATTNSKKLTGLLPNTTYEYKVKTQCDPYPASGFSATINFTTLPLREGSFTEHEKLDIYPNPAQQLCSIDPGDVPDGNYTVHVTDMQGQQVMTYDVELQGNPITLDIAVLANGVYNVSLSNSLTQRTGMLVIVK
jgi:hypothetical protein